ncbi:hypothetical protein DMUE_3312 [Dictyocoela muelleri]|nr:hypothetical protein DMUE_3312 [Dictyocoela muelleri]
MNNILSFINSASNSEFVNFLRMKRLIATNQNCDYCGTEMVQKKTKDNNLGFNHRTLNYKCDHYQTTKSLLTVSFFSNFQLNPRQILSGLYFLCLPLVVSEITQVSEISKNTVSKIKKAFITTIIKYFDENSIHLGGEGRVVTLMKQC